MSLSGAFKRLVTRNSTFNQTRVITETLNQAVLPVVERLEERQMLSHSGHVHTSVHHVGVAAPAPTFPAIVVKGTNAGTIAYQENSPITADGTDFGSLDTKANKIETFTIGNTGAGVLNLTAFSRVQVTGANAADFIVTAQPGASVLQNGSTTFKLKFAPSTAAVENATVTIYNDTDGKDPFTFAVKGTGTQVSKAQVTGNGKVLAANDTTVQVSDNTQFGNVESNGGSVTKTFTLKNLASGTLHLSGNPLAVVTGDTAVFSVVTPPPATLASGASADFTVKFQPNGATGAKNAVITMSTDDPNAASYHFAVQGTGVAQPVMSVVGAHTTALTNNQTATGTTDGTDFGNVDLASGAVTQTFTIKNAGGAALSLSGTPIIDIQGTNKTAFTVVAQPASTVGAASNGTPGSVTFQVRFAPGTVGTKTATVVIANSDTVLGAPFKFNLTGNGISQGKIQVTGGVSNTTIVGDGTNTAGANSNADNTSFGTVDKTGGSATHTFTINDLGSATLRLTGTPKVTVAEGGGGTDFSIVTQPSISLLSGATPGNTHVGSAPAPVSVNKHGHHVSHGLRKHTVSVAPAPVIPSTITFAVKFAPADDTIAGKTAVVTIASDDPSVPAYTFNIAGTATSSSLMGLTGGANAAKIVNGDNTATVAKGTDFGSIDITQTVTQTFTVTNTGTSDLTFTGGAALSDSTDFAIPNGRDIAGPIATGASATFQVSFHPAAGGTKTGTVTLTTNDPNAASYVFAVKGIAAASPVEAVTSSVSDGNGGFTDVAIAAGATTTSTGNNTDFGNTELTNGSVTETFKINNTGSTTLNIAHIIKGGANATDFGFVGNPPATVAANASGTFQVRFRPTAAGIRTGTITVQTNDAANPNYTFAIKGTAVRQPALAVYGLGHAITATTNTPGLSDNTDFGSTDPAAPVIHTFTIRNNGSDALNLTSALAIGGANALDFAVLNRPRTSIPAGGSGTFDVKFTPSGVGAEVGTITIASDDPTTPSWVINLAGTGVAAPLETVKGGPNQNVVITPGASTAKSADGSDFGQSVVNLGTVTNTFTITNTGSASLNLTTMTVTGTNSDGHGDFTIVTTPTSPVVATTGTTTFTIKFAPTATGTRSAVITIPSDDPNHASYTFVVRGTGISVPVIALTSGGTPIVSGSTTSDVSNNTDFGSVEQANGTATQTFQINNTGSAALTLIADNISKKIVTISGANAADFTVVAQPDTSIATGASKTFQIKFAPKGAGVRTAVVTILSNDAADSSYTYTITGTAVQQPVISVQGNNKNLTNGQNAQTADSTDFGNVKNGVTSSKTFTIKNIGSQTLNLTGTDLVHVDGLSAGDFVVTQPGVASLAAGASTTFTVAFSPTVVGAESAQISIDSDDRNGTFSFNLAGTGTAAL